MCSPFFSVVIPAHNRKNLLLRALESLSMQTFFDFEVVVVDDFSSEDLKSVCDKFSNVLNIIYERNLKNSGGGFSRNVGITKSHGLYIAFLDSDDYFNRDKLEILAQVIKANKQPPVVFNSSLIRKRDDEVKAIITCSKDYSSFMELIVLGGNLLQTSACTVRANIAKNLMFDDSLTRHQDLDFYVRLTEFYQNAVFLTDILSVWDISHESPSITKIASFEVSHGWIKKVRANVGDRVYYNFLLKFIYARTSFIKLAVLKELTAGLYLNYISKKDFFTYIIIKLFRTLRRPWI